MAYWLKFEKKSGCVDISFEELGMELPIDYNEYKKKSEELLSIIITNLEIACGKFISKHTLPYPATPIFYQSPAGKYPNCPAFCFDPERCKDHTSCTKSLSCVE